MSDRELEIEKRRTRAREEAFTIAPIPSKVVEKFWVKGASGRGYKVLIDRDMKLKTCECHDFLNAGLGTCKHIEAVLIQARSSPMSKKENSGGTSAGETLQNPKVESSGPELMLPVPDASGLQSSQKSPRHLVCFDVETQNSFDDVGGRQNFGKLRVSIGVVYDEALNQYFVYSENEMTQLIDHLFTADLVVGYNILGFDYPVIQPYSTRQVKTLPTLDLMNELALRLGFRVKLDSVVHATLGARKSGHGLQAIEWFRAGEMEKLTQYCQDDVRLTYELFKFGAANGFVYIDSRGSRQRVLVDWK